MVPAVRKWMWLSLAATLMLGGGLGVLADRFFLAPTVMSSDVDRVQSREGDSDTTHRRRILEKLQTELALTEEQSAALEKVLERNHDTAHRFWKQSREQYGALRQQFREDIAALLDDAQRARFREILAEVDARRSERRRDADDRRDR